jgi:hypothetical protein
MAPPHRRLSRLAPKRKYPASNFKEAARISGRPEVAPSGKQYVRYSDAVFFWNLGRNKPDGKTSANELLQTRARGRLDLQGTRPMHRHQRGPGDLQFSCQKAIQTLPCRVYGIDRDYNSRPQSNHPAHRCLCYRHLGRHFNPITVSPERTEIEFSHTDPRWVAPLHGTEVCVRDRSDGQSFSNGPVPGSFADCTFVDQPCVQFAPIGVQSDFAIG